MCTKRIAVIGKWSLKLTNWVRAYANEFVVLAEGQQFSKIM
jgi:hypothetical protein